jgi:hypothetical protein
MTVNQLIDALEKLDGNMPIAVSRDSEGNGFSPLYQLSQESMEKIDKMGRMLEWSEGKDCQEYIVFWPSR